MIVPNLEGKTILTAGGTAGSGMESAVDLAGAGAQVVVTCRERGKGDLALQEIRRRSGSTKVDLLVGNFESQESTRELAAEFLAKYPKLHVLVNTAGTASVKRELTEDGIEKTFAVNHLAPFLLTNLLLDLLKRSAPAKVINVASIEHRQGTVPFDNLQFEKGGYGVVRAYARSQLANVLFTMELPRRLAGAGVTANCLHPGAVATNIWSHGPGYVRLVLPVAKLFMLSAEKGADTIVYLAANPEVEGLTGGYYERNRKVTPSPLARDHAIPKRLWDRSAALVGLPP